MSRLSLYVNDNGRCVTHYSGFSSLAGVFPLIWALQRRHPLLIVIALLYGVAANVIISQFGGYAMLGLYLTQFIILGTLANRFHLALLARGGWLRTEEELAPPEGNSA
jgi:hypothetical protein